MNEVFTTVLSSLREDESRKLQAYLDSEGVWTIGYGHTRGVKQGDTCTISQAEAWLLSDLKVAAADLNKYASWWTGMPTAAQCGLLNMSYNLGWPKLSEFHKMLSALQAGRFITAGDEALNSRWAAQVKGRANRIAQLFHSCAEENKGTV